MPVAKKAPPAKPAATRARASKAETAKAPEAPKAAKSAEPKPAKRDLERRLGRSAPLVIATVDSTYTSGKCTHFCSDTRTTSMSVRAAPSRTRSSAATSMVGIPASCAPRRSMMRQSPSCPGPCPGLRRRRGGVWGLGQHQEELPPFRPLVVRVSGKRLAASSVGVRSGVVIRGIRRRRCVGRRPRRVPLHEPRHLIIRHRVLVEETHVAITSAPTRPVVAGSHQATARPAPRGD